MRSARNTHGEAKRLPSGSSEDAQRKLSAEPRKVLSTGNRWTSKFLLIQLLASVSRATSESLDQ